MIDRFREIIDRLGRQGTDSKAITTVLVAAAVVSASTLAVGVALLGFGSQSVLAASVTVDDINVSTATGNLTSVTITPNLTYSWSNLDTGVHNIDTDVEVSDDGSNWELAVTSHLLCSNLDSKCGTKTATVNNDMTTISIAGGGFAQTDQFSLSEFNASDGATKTTTVHVRFTVNLTDDTGSTIKQTQVVKSFDVMVTNKASTLGVEGDVNASATTPLS